MRYVFLIFLFSALFSNDQIPGNDQKRPILLKGGTLSRIGLF